MESGALIFNKFTIIIVIAALLAFIFRALKQPIILAYILAGALVGPRILNLSENGSELSLLSTLGVTLLLFAVGLNMRVRDIKKIAIDTGLITLAQIFSISFFGFVTLYYGFDLRIKASIIISLCLGLSSTIIAIKQIGDRGDLGRLYSGITLGILVIQDILAGFLFILISALSDNDGGNHMSQILGLGLKSGAIIAGLIIIGLFIMPKIEKKISESQEILFLTSLAWALSIASLVARLGLSLELGALAAGMTLSGTIFASEVAAKLRPVKDLFIVIFFMEIGIVATANNGSVNIQLILAITFLSIILRPFLFYLPLKLSGYSKRTAAQVTTNMISLSEFSVVMAILAYHEKLIQQDVLGSIVIAMIVSIVLGSYAPDLIRKQKLSNKSRKKGILAARHNFIQRDIIQFGWAKGGSDLYKTFSKFSKSVLVVDYNPRVIDQLTRDNIDGIFGDASDIDLLQEIGVKKAKLITITINDFGLNEYLVRFVKKVNPNCIIIAYGADPDEAKKLYKLGAIYVSVPSYIGSEKLNNFILKNKLDKQKYKSIAKTEFI